MPGSESTLNCELVREKIALAVARYVMHGVLLPVEILHIQLSHSSSSTLDGSFFRTAMRG